jgi:hypothetical protein
MNSYFERAAAFNHQQYYLLELVGISRLWKKIPTIQKYY